ncbi:MAG: TolC family protein [Thermodesulfobacteriota bacterium]
MGTGTGFKKGASSIYPLLIALALVLSPDEGRGAGAGGGAEGVAIEPATLKELIEYGVENNPRIGAAKLRWMRVAEKYPQATSLSDPMLTYTLPIEKVETRLGSQDHIIMLSQKLPYPGKLALKGEVVNKDAAIARTGYERVVRDVTAKIKKSFYELYYIDHAIELAEENKTVLEYFSKITTTNYGIDEKALDGLIRAQTQYGKASSMLITLREMRSAREARLNALLNRAPGEPVGTPAEPILKPLGHSLDELYEWGSENQELRISRLRVEKNELKKRLSGYAYRPDFRVGLNYIVTGDPPMSGIDDAGRDAVALTFGLNIPLWSRKNRAAVNEAGLGIAEALEERAALTREVTNSIKGVYHNLKANEQLIALYRDSLIPEARQSMEIAETWYKNGRGPLSGLLETQSIWLNFKLAYHRAVADYLKNTAEIERLTGREFY